MTFGKIGARRMMANLPYDYELEYLESTGTQYIDTGLKAGNGYAFEYWGNGVRNEYRCAIGGGEANNVNEITAFFYSANSYVRNGSYNSVSTSGLFFADEGFDGFTVVCDGNNVSWTDKNGVTQSRSLAPTGWTVEDTTCPFILFGYWRGSSAMPLAGKTPFVKIKRYGTIVRDFIPVRIGSVGAMYDRRGVGGMNSDGSARTDGLYFNRGTGAFIVGPDKVA